MKQRAFNARAHEVRNILANEVVQVRRIIKPQPHSGVISVIETFNGPNLGGWICVSSKSRKAASEIIRCPFGKVGDRLWWREGWNTTLKGQNLLGEFIKTADQCVNDNGGFGCPCGDGVVYAVDLEGPTKTHPIYGQPRWCFSTRMPQWASRITSEIIDVCVERIQSISWDDAKVSGVTRYSNNKYSWVLESESIIEFPSPVAAFQNQWDSNYPGSWDRNDWVFALTLKRIKP